MQNHISKTPARSGARGSGWWLLALVGCGERGPAPEVEPAGGAPTGAPAEPSPRASLVLVTLDTTRVDRIGAYGYPGGTTPQIDALAAGGARFDRAWSAVPLTTPSHATMMTGLYPPRHGVRTNGDAVLSDELETVAERLQAAGWRTGASVSAFVTTRAWNLDQGFEAYFDDVGEAERDRWARERPADAVVDDAIGWLEGLGDDAPFFLWVHLYDPHTPYAPPEPWASSFEGRPYDGEIAFMDSEIGRLRAAVEAAAGEAGAHWILAADHGEAFNNEHGEPAHGIYLFESTSRIPFIVRPAAALTEPLAVDAVEVSGADVAPTALGLLGQAPIEGVDGRDLSPLLQGEALERGGVYMESWTAAQRFGYHPEIAWVDWPLKLMDTPSPRLFDLSADPAEAQDLASARPEEVARLQGPAREVVASEAVAGGAELSTEVIQQLAALGYIGAGQSVDDALSSTLDAKDHVGTLQRIQRAILLSQQGDSAGAEAIYRQIIAEEPQITEARVGLVRLLEQAGRVPEAEGVLRDALALEPESSVLHQSLGLNLWRQGRPAEGLAEVEAVLALVPTDRNAQLAAMRMLSQLQRDEEALERGRGWLEMDPDSSGLNAQFGITMARIGRGREAESYLQRSLRDGVAHPFVHEILARLATERGDVVAARAHVRAELEAFPWNNPARWAMANMLMVDQAWEEAAAEYRYIAESKAADPNARRMWSQAVFNAGDYARAEEILAPVLEGYPDDPFALMLQANVLAMTGRMAEGEATKDRAIAIRQELRGAPTGARALGAPSAEDLAPR